MSQGRNPAELRAEDLKKGGGGFGYLFWFSVSNKLDLQKGKREKGALPLNHKALKPHIRSPKGPSRNTLKVHQMMWK